jgi:RNA polymerase sigma factor (sigma-70 family)
MIMPPPVECDGISEHTLLRGFAAGDADFGEVFVRRFQGRVYGVAVHLLGDQGLAEEVAQETFVRAWKHAAAYDPERGSVAAWLGRTSRNLAIDVLRRRRPRALDPDLIATLIPATTATSVEDAAVTSDLAAKVRAAVARLPAKQARALWLAVLPIDLVDAGNPGMS